MKTFISIALTAIFILTDLLAGNLALFPTLTVYCAAGLLIAYGWKYGLAAALAGGVIVDLIYGHTMAFYGVIFPLATAAAGAIIQAVLHNPMAAPNIIGVNSGAGLAVSIVVGILPAAVWAIPAAAFLGALAACLLAPAAELFLSCPAVSTALFPHIWPQKEVSTLFLSTFSLSPILLNWQKKK